ncbi:LysR family transcriptional regulator [Glaesserella parasuis]|uniref:LysR family transcriptional regulator n=1 Tax=Glaesserella parasuis TaxID=738 RepID=A0AAJ6ACB5_GLAPU|nr:LysR family transcriptional regulator [Glaesserella parasuis]MCT8574393.1 LysR family transcriptional regulator [Glaesserella parasuis]MCT8655255.1 LysR family transcriptional regulator [Glaesserella parasuis]MCT8836231.1 LysR family transcriptional regulator [Glaesserella parasuis]MDG6310268.1 LysR family transcriptional regulator [Glaesserella parasuis]MDO9750580.1 LysR family transcriptional regulator [Glaesserella parasuis]
MDKLTAIKVFLTVAETGSFTATAEQLEISKPMISRYVALMEEWLNARLFQRSTRKVALTDAGEQAVLFCQRIANLTAEMEQEMMVQQSELRGALRVTSSQTFGTYHLVQMVNRFLQLHPKLNIQLLLNDQQMDLISERIDLAIRITNTPDPNFIARKLADCHSLLVATPDYLAQFGTPKHPEDLYQHHYLSHHNINRKAWKCTQGEREVLLDLNSRFTTNDTQALLNAVLDGNGIAMLPKYMLETELQQCKLQSVLTDWQLPTFSIYAIYPSRDKLPLAVRKLIDFLVESFEGKAW